RPIRTRRRAWRRLPCSPPTPWRPAPRHRFDRPRRRRWSPCSATARRRAPRQRRRAQIETELSGIGSWLSLEHHVVFVVFEAVRAVGFGQESAADAEVKSSRKRDSATCPRELNLVL